MKLHTRTNMLKFIDATIGAVLCSMLGKLNYIRNSDSISSIEDLSSIKRLLVIRPGGMGDMIILLPVLKTLQSQLPNASIDIICEKRNADVAMLAGINADIITYDSNPLLALHKLRKRKYDISIDAEQFHHFSAIFSFLSSAPVRIGYKINPRRNPLYTHLVDYAQDRPEGLQFTDLLKGLNIPSDSYKLDGCIKETLNKTDSKDLPQHRPYIIMHPGATSKYKLWNADNFAELATRLKKEKDINTLLVGQRRDQSTINSIIESAKTSGCDSIDYAGDTDIATTANLMKEASLFIGCDSGLAHLATATGLPTIVLFGSSNHLKWGIENHRHVVVRKDLPCSPCYIFGYNKPCHHIDCMHQITVDDVMDAYCRISLTQAA